MTRTVPHKAILGFTLALAALAAIPARAGWRDVIAASDADHLIHLEEARAAAVQEAEHGRGTGDFRAIQETFQPDAHGVPERALLGDWRCRQMKLGGMTDYAVFSWFPCHIRRVNGGIWFEKEGTQRMAGYLYPEDGGLWIYLGAQSARDEPWHRYSGNGPSIGGTVNPDDQTGALVGIGRNRLRLDLPSPNTEESDFDSIELVR